MSELTERQKQILNYMQSHRKTTYPTVREIAKAFGISSSTAQQHRKAIIDKTAEHLIGEQSIGIANHADSQ